MSDDATPPPPGRPESLQALARRAERMAAAGEAARFKPSPLRMMAGVLWLLVGMATGWVAHERLVPRAPVGAVPAVVREAAAAHAAYAPETRHAVEMGGSDQLFEWLGDRLGAPVRAPNLQAAGLALAGGRLLPGPAAWFLYDGQNGERLSLYVTRAAARSDGTVRYAQGDGAATVWWTDGPLTYALAGQADNQTLQRVAQLARER